MKTYLRLIRLPNLLIIILAQYLSIICIIKPVLGSVGIALSLSNIELFLVVILTLLISFAGYIINDFYDRKIDEINKPGLNLFSRFNRTHLLLLYAVFNISGIFLGFYLAKISFQNIMGWLVAVIVILLWLYSARYKRYLLLGNIIVSFLSAMVVIIVWLFEFFKFRSVNDYTIEYYEIIMTINVLILFYALFAFILSLIREIVKDIEDMEGDAQAHCKTLPIVAGVKISKLIIGSLMSAVVLCLFFLQYQQLSVLYNALSWYFGFAVQLPMVYLIYKIIIADTKADFHNISTFLKIIMFLGILSMLFIRIL